MGSVRSHRPTIAVSYPAPREATPLPLDLGRSTADTVIRATPAVPPTICRTLVATALISSVLAVSLQGQDSPRLFPDRALLPSLFSGPRDPVTKAELVYVTDNPNLFGEGVEAELSLGIGLPLLRLAGHSTHDAVVVGVEGAAFARFGLHRTEREMIGTDWVFAVPLVWHRGHHWLRFRYYHTSSHLGDEYSRRFDVEGMNFARDAVDALGFLRLVPIAGAYAGARWAYSVHPEDSGRWTLRAGIELGRTDGTAALLPYGTADVEIEDDTDWTPVVSLQAGVWLPEVGGRRALRFGVGFLTGPPPLGQFRSERTTQITVGVSASL